MNKLFIEDCRSLYSNHFPEDWIEKEKWDDHEKATASIDRCIANMKDFVNKFFVCISKSVLCGEYISHEDKVREVRTYFEECAQKEHECPETEQIDDSVLEIKRMVYEEYEELDFNIEKMFFKYENLIQKVKEKIDALEHNVIVEAYRVKTKNPEPKLFSYFNNQIISICIDEHRMRYDKKRMGDYLLMIQEIDLALNKEPDEDVIFILKVFREKVLLLLRKLYHFFKKKGEYTIDFTTYTLDTDKFSIVLLKDFLQNFGYVHEDKPIPYEYIEKIQSNCAQKSAKLSEFTILMKYYSCGNGSRNQIENLLTDFNKMYKSLYRKAITKAFDKHALDTVKNYMYNCRLSFLIRSKNYTIDNLIKDIDEISSIQKETKIKNYYPYKKALEFLKGRIKTRLGRNELSDNKEVLLSWISIFNEYVEKFEDSFRWCDNNNFYPIQLMYNECCVNVVDGDEFRLFIPSTFTRPQNFEKICEALNGFKSDSLFFREMSEFIEYREDVNSLRKDFKQSERKIIEIGGLFVTVITFLFGTIQIYSKTDMDARALTMSTLAFGCLLVVFSSSIYFITLQQEYEDKSYLKSLRFWFFGIASIVYTLILIRYLIII